MSYDGRCGLIQQGEDDKRLIHTLQWHRLGVGLINTGSGEPSTCAAARAPILSR